MSGPTGVYVNGRLVADKHHRRLAAVIDPDTGDTVYITEDGKEYWREKPRVTSGDVDVARINILLGNREPENALTALRDAAAIGAIFLFILMVAAQVASCYIDP